MFLFKPSNSSTSQPVDFYFYPDRNHVQTKRTKTVTNGLSQTTLNPTLKDLIQKSSSPVLYVSELIKFFNFYFKKVQIIFYFFVFLI